VTGVGELTVPAVTANVADVWPWGIVTFPGALAPAGDELIPIVAPPLSADDVSDTEQVEPADGDIEVGLHERPFRAGVWDIVTFPPLVVVDIPNPVGSDDIPLAS
jgi:hypothetical protein